VLTVALCAVIGAILNRFSGYTNVSWLPGRNVYYALVAILALSWLAFGPLWASLITASAALYRIPGWYDSIDMGTNEGTLFGDFAIMYLRGMFFAPVFVVAGMFYGADHAAAYLVIASLLASFSYVAGNYNMFRKVKDPFIVIELLAGACFGAAVGGVMVAVNG
jgi:hypothetical protein